MPTGCGASPPLSRSSHGFRARPQMAGSSRCARESQDLPLPSHVRSTCCPHPGTSDLWVVTHLCQLTGREHHIQKGLPGFHAWGHLTSVGDFLPGLGSLHALGLAGSSCLVALRDTLRPRGHGFWELIFGLSSVTVFPVTFLHLSICQMEVFAFGLCRLEYPKGLRSRPASEAWGSYAAIPRSRAALHV